MSVIVDLVVVMHLLALGAFWPERTRHVYHRQSVVMHLLALGAFWQYPLDDPRHELALRRNAPSGARCFLASTTRVLTPYN